jgi:DNA-directed RNA polymerase subunit alpha
MIHKNWAELIKPTLLDVTPGNDPARQATVIAEPLERGFGLTLGNAIAARRCHYCRPDRQRSA